MHAHNKRDMVIVKQMWRHVQGEKKFMEKYPKLGQIQLRYIK